VAHLLAQDVIYVGGGSMRNMLAIWREHSIDVAMRDAWASGTVLAGLSAGAMCWFEGGVSKSGGMPEAVHGIGLLSGSLSVHMDSEPERLPVYCDAVSGGRLPAGFAADDGAGLVFGGLALRECVASRPGARVLRVTADASGGGGGGAGGAGAEAGVSCSADAGPGVAGGFGLAWTGRLARSRRTGWPSCGSCGRGRGGGGTRPLWWVTVGGESEVSRFDRRNGAVKG